MSSTAQEPLSDLFSPVEELTSDLQKSGVEVERIEREFAEIKDPFDPNKIDVKTKPMTVDLMMSRVKGGDSEIDLMPDFQRRAGIWDETRKSRLIESLLLRIPLPVFYVAADPNEKWSVVDGLQRITTLKEYIVDQAFALKNLEFLRDLNGLRYNSLSRQAQRRISEAEITVHIIQAGTPSAVMFNIFKRINTGGMPLSSQEIRHAIKQGPATKFLRELAESDEFRAATRNSIKDERMADRECVLRFCAFYMTNPQAYRGNDLDAFLVGCMDQLNALDDFRRMEIGNRFLEAMRTARSIFGKWAFRKYYGADFRLSPINKALFEAWSVNLANMTPNDVELLIAKRKEVLEKFALRMTSDSDYNRSVSVATGSDANVRYRFAVTLGILEEVLHVRPPEA